MNVLVLGAGAREHALVQALHLSPLITSIHATPFNPGIAKIALCHDVAVDDIEALVLLAKKHHIDIVIPGPELPLTLGITDALQHYHIYCFGPNKESAMLEASKQFMKDVCYECGIPTAPYKNCYSLHEAQQTIAEWGAPIVLKTDGLASGKGVIIAETMAEAEKALHMMMVDKKFGSAGEKIICEKKLYGEELSWFAMVDGEEFVPLGCAQDHKNIYEGDKGPNTGGMGAYAIPPIWNQTLEHHIQDSIVRPLLKTMVERGTGYHGFLFLGLMIQDNIPSLIEINVRFGDPECATLMPLWRNDLLTMICAARDHQLSFINCLLHEQHSISIVLVAKGYPETYPKNMLITLPDCQEEDVYIFHAGTDVNQQQQLVAKGGRVLTIQACAPTLKKAREKVLNTIKTITFEHSYYRADIGWRAIGSFE